MRDLAVLFIHLITTVARLAGPGGARSVVAESVLVKQQLLILNRPRKRSPNLRVADRVVAGLCALLMRPGRLICSAIVLKPSTLLGLHRALKNRKYRLLFSPKGRKRPGPKGPSYKVIAAVVQMKQRNPTWGCPQIAQQMGWPSVLKLRFVRKIRGWIRALATCQVSDRVPVRVRGRCESHTIFSSSLWLCCSGLRRHRWRAFSEPGNS